MSSVAEYSEKRQSSRVPVALTAHCRIGQRYVKDAIADLSPRGLYLKTREPAREGTPVRIAFSIPADEGTRFCTLIGNVAHVARDGHGLLLGLGVRVSDEETEEADLATLLRFLASR